MKPYAVLNANDPACYSMTVRRAYRMYNFQYIIPVMCKVAARSARRTMNSAKLAKEIK